VLLTFVAVTLQPYGNTEHAREVAKRRIRSCGEAQSCIRSSEAATRVSHNKRVIMITKRLIDVFFVKACTSSLPNGEMWPDESCSNGVWPVSPSVR
jgi:hypothetical protein